MLKRKPKIFILGASGFIGFQLAMRLREKFSVSGAYFSNPVYLPDAQLYPAALKNLDVLEHLVRAQAPDFVVNAVGLTDPATCLKYPKVAESLNAMLPISFAIIANRTKAKFIHLSCGQIFDGIDGNYEENDVAFSMAIEYSKQKIAAEAYIRAQTMESNIIRLGKIVGPGHHYRPSYFDKIRFNLSAHVSFDISAMKTYSYISTKSAVSAIEQMLTHPFPFLKHRTFHVGGANITEADLVSSYCRLLELDSKLLKITQNPSEKRNISMNSGLFESQHPEWKAETKNQLLANLLEELCPAVGIKKWQKTLQIP